eukprot:m.339420 g.339420  ORF g.339420 m.339420 type:complete len:115 (-) comp18794_c0_seq1:286-630(-)
MPTHEVSERVVCGLAVVAGANVVAGWVGACVLTLVLVTEVLVMVVTVVVVIVVMVVVVDVIVIVVSVSDVVTSVEVTHPDPLESHGSEPCAEQKPKIKHRTTQAFAIMPVTLEQ